VGLAKCARCGGAIEINSRRQGRQRQRHYACATSRRGGVHKCPGLDVVPLRRVDEAVLDVLADDLLSPTRIERVCQDVVAHFADPAQSAVARRQELLKRRAELDATISRLVDAIAAGGECAALVARITTSERERVELDRELAALEARAESVVTIETIRKAIDRLLLEWRQALLEAPKNVALARQVVQKLVDRRIEFVPAERDEEAGMLITVPGSLVRPVAIAINRDEAAVAQTVDSRPPEQSAGSWPESGSCAQAVASLMPGSWNEIASWLQQVEGLRHAA
jgi:recombinase-like zinc beta ribbon protein